MARRNMSATQQTFGSSDWNARFGAKADMTMVLVNVRFTSESRHDAATPALATLTIACCRRLVPYELSAERREDRCTRSGPSSFACSGRRGRLL